MTTWFHATTSTYADGETVRKGLFRRPIHVSESLEEAVHEVALRPGPAPWPIRLYAVSPIDPQTRKGQVSASSVAIEAEEDLAPVFGPQGVEVLRVLGSLDGLTEKQRNRLFGRSLRRVDMTRWIYRGQIDPAVPASYADPRHDEFDSAALRALYLGEQYGRATQQQVAAKIANTICTCRETQLDEVVGRGNHISRGAILAAAAVVQDLLDASEYAAIRSVVEELA